MIAPGRLAAILAADVVGYSRLTGEDGTGTAKAVRERREASMPIVAGHGGPHRQDDARRPPHGVHLPISCVRADRQPDGGRGTGSASLTTCARLGSEGMNPIRLCPRTPPFPT
jgi:class 3 adenylate cyclase